MRTYEIDKHISPHLRAVHLEAAGVDAIEATLPDGSRKYISRRASEPWGETLPRVAHLLEGEGYRIAGNPQTRKRRPQLLLVVHDSMFEDGQIAAERYQWGLWS